jgi:hypothetical protein
MPFYNECNTCTKHCFTLKCNCSWNSCVTCWTKWYIKKGDKVNCPHCQTENFPSLLSILFLIKSYYVLLLNIKHIICETMKIVLNACVLYYIIGEIVQTVFNKDDKLVKNISDNNIFIKILFGFHCSCIAIMLTGFGLLIMIILSKLRIIN